MDVYVSYQDNWVLSHHHAMIVWNWLRRMQPDDFARVFTFAWPNVQLNQGATRYYNGVFTFVVTAVDGQPACVIQHGEVNSDGAIQRGLCAVVDLAIGNMCTRNLFTITNPNVFIPGPALIAATGVCAADPELMKEHVANAEVALVRFARAMGFAQSLGLQVRGICQFARGVGYKHAVWYHPSAQAVLVAVEMYRLTGVHSDVLPLDVTLCTTADACHAAETGAICVFYGRPTLLTARCVNGDLSALCAAAAHAYVST